MVTIGDALKEGARVLGETSPSAALDARVLLEHILSRDHAWLLAHGSETIDSGCRDRFRTLVERRKQGEPVAYLVGWKEFWSMRLEVDCSVLVPRPETEHLVEHALALIPPDAPWRIADLGTGSGAIALALALERPHSNVTATDISARALEMAQKNTRRLGVDNVDFVLGDWFTPLSGRRFDLILSNPPYVADGDACLDDRETSCEPTSALQAGPDGLLALRTIGRQARRYLADGGCLLLEHGFSQETEVARILRQGGFEEIHCYPDYAGHPRTTIARTGGARRALGD